MFQGWKIAFLGLLGNLTIYGGMIYMMNVFLYPLHEIRGWSLASISYVMGIGSFCVSLATVFVISLSFYFKLRTLMTLGAIIGGLGFFGIGFAENFYFFALCFSLTWGSGQLFGGAIANILMSNWFIKKRGRALGLTNIGTSLSGVVLPFFCLFLLENFGIEIAYSVLGLILLSFAPLCYIIVRDNPNEMGLFPDNEDNQEENSSEVEENTSINTDTSERQKYLSHICTSFLNFYRDRASFCLSFSYGLALLGIAGLLSQLKPALESMGFDAYSATLFVTITAFCAATGKYFWGYVSDKTNPIFVVRLIMFGNFISLLLLFLPISYFTISLFACFFGLCSGGMWPILATLVYYFYGKDNFKKAYQYASIMIALKSFGYILIGFMLEVFGSYHHSYFLFAIILLIAFLIILFVKKEDAIEFQTLNKGAL